MGAGSLSNEVLSPVSPSRLWMAMVKDSHNLMPKLMPDIISSVVQHHKAIQLHQRIDTIDEEKRVFKYSVIEGGLIGKKVKSTSFELKFEADANGGSLCKLNSEYETIEESLPTEAETKEMMGSMLAMFKATEGYLVANPDVYV